MNACHAERGQAVLATVIWIAVAAALVLGLARLAEVAADDARAAVAADAAALAGAAADDDAASTAASLNGANVERIERQGAEVQVWVRIGRSLATARAVREVVETDSPIGYPAGANTAATSNTLPP